MEITIKQIEKLEEILKFYYEEENYEWEGCSCHGHWQLLDHGEKAGEGLDVIEVLLKQE